MVRRKSMIFGFLLYDSRPSQQTIKNFTQKQAPWIDELARGAGIYFFFPFKKEGENFRNPSPEITRLFNLGVSRLPGIILFAPPASHGKIISKHAVYIPLEEKDFDDDRVYEPLLSQLFDLIRDSIEISQNSHEVLVRIKDQLVRLRRKKNERAFASYIRKGAHLVLFELPKAILSSFSEALGKALVEKVVPIPKV